MNHAQRHQNCDGLESDVFFPLLSISAFQELEFLELLAINRRLQEISPLFEANKLCSREPSDDRVEMELNGHAYRSREGSGPEGNKKRKPNYIEIDYERSNGLPPSKSFSPTSLTQYLPHPLHSSSKSSSEANTIQKDFSNLLLTSPPAYTTLSPPLFLPSYQPRLIPIPKGGRAREELQMNLKNRVRVQLELSPVLRRRENRGWSF